YLGNALLKTPPGAHAAGGGHGHEPESRPTRWFRGVLVGALRRRKLVIIGTAGAFVLSVVLFGLVEQQFFPSSSRPELLVDLRLAQSASIKATEKEVERFEQILKNDPDVLYYTFYV